MKFRKPKKVETYEGKVLRLNSEQGSRFWIGMLIKWSNLTGKTFGAD